MHSGGGLGWVCRSRFFVSKVSGAFQRGVGGTLEGSGLATSIGFATAPSLPSSESLLLDLLAARIDVYEENERRSTPHTVLLGPTGCPAGQKRARTQLTKEIY